MHEERTVNLHNPDSMEHEGMTTRQRPIRRLAIGLFALFLVGVVAAEFASRGVTGGQTSSSPDGNYRIDIFRRMDPSKTDPYRITLSQSANDKTLKRIDVIPVDGSPNQALRGGKRAIQWSEQSTFADIVLDGEHVCRIYTN